MTLALSCASCAAFAPSTIRNRAHTNLFSEEPEAAVSLDSAEETAPEPEPVPVDVFTTPKDLPGVVGPLGFFDPLNFAENASSGTMRRYREAEITHGRVSMVAVLGFFAGEFVVGNTMLFDGEVSGPAISHLSQLPSLFWVLLTIGIGASESTRLNIGWVDPEGWSAVPVSQPGLLRSDYTPGDINFDPLNLKPSDPEELKTMQTKELQNGRLAMIAASGFLAQELVNGKGILENLGI